MDSFEMDTRLEGNEGNWTFIGAPRWKQDERGVIHPPIWSHPDFDCGPSQPPAYYAEELARQDFAFLSGQPLSDTDLSVEFKTYYASIIEAEVVFRAMDSARCYVLHAESMAHKAQEYECTLWLQEASGYRRELARVRTPHAAIPPGSPKNRKEWEEAHPGWAQVRIQASSDLIRVWMDGRIIIEVRDGTYPAGCVGLCARGPALFRNLKVQGTPAELPSPWTAHEGELPRFFYPGGEQPEGWNAFPGVARTDKGTLLVSWIHAKTWPWYTKALDGTENTAQVVLTRSEDEGGTWTGPKVIFQRHGWEFSGYSGFSYAHRDGTMTCLLVLKPNADGPFSGEPRQLLALRSSDDGASWSEPEEVLISGRRFEELMTEDCEKGIYAPPVRLSDGTMLMCGWECCTPPGAGEDAHRLDRSILFRSCDDGYTWEGPTYFDEKNFDHNECMLVETEPGRLVAFMRTGDAPYMWMSTSEDYGLSWTPLVQSSVSGTCPYLLGHSSGALILFSRGSSSYIKLSFDRGNTWTRETRISPASAMVGMTETTDGRVLIAMHEGYRVPGYIRGQFFRVAPDSPVPA